MTNRVVVGSRSGVMGLWVSRPGYDVLTASDEGMLLSPSLSVCQPIISGTVNMTTTTTFVPLSVSLGAARVFIWTSWLSNGSSLLYGRMSAWIASDTLYLSFSDVVDLTNLTSTSFNITVTYIVFRATY